LQWKFTSDAYEINNEIQSVVEFSSKPAKQ